jgi:hypothetical protein
MPRRETWGTQEALTSVSALPISSSALLRSLPTFLADLPAFPSRTISLAGRESALQWRHVTSQLGSHSLKSVNLVVDALHNRVEVHCLNVSGGSAGVCKNCQFVLV